MNNRRTGITLSYVVTFLNMVSGMALSAFLLRSLGDFEYGMYQTITAFVNYLVVLEFGIGTVICRDILVARRSDDQGKLKKAIATIWYMGMALSVLILAVGLVFYRYIHVLYAKSIPADRMAYAETMFLVMLFYLLCSFVFQTVSGIFFGYENYTLNQKINLVKVIVRTVALFVLIAFFRYSILIALTDALMSLAIAVFSVSYAKKRYHVTFRFRDFDPSICRNALPLCFALMLQTLVAEANGNIDKFFISIQIGMESVALYSIAMYVYSVFSTLTAIPLPMYMPQITKDIGNGLKGKELTHSMIPFGRLVSLTGGTVLFGFIAVGKRFIGFFYGREYTLAWITAILVMIPMFLSMTVGAVTNMLNVINKRHIQSGVLCFAALLNILLTAWFVRIWGVMGAAVATAIGMILGQLVILNLYYFKALSIHVLYLYWQACKGIVPVQIVSAAVGYSIAEFIKTDWVAFLAGGFSFVAAEAIGLLLFGFNGEEKRLLKINAGKIRKGRRSV